MLAPKTKHQSCCAAVSYCAARARYLLRNGGDVYQACELCAKDWVWDLVDSNEDVHLSAPIRQVDETLLLIEVLA